MSRRYLTSNSIDEELNKLIEKYREKHQESYEYLIKTAKKYELEGKEALAKDYLQRAIEHKKALDNPSILWYEAKHELMTLCIRLPRKDNSPLSFGSWRKHDYYRNKIRVPRLKRKTAWKRFYKIFPYLKGDECLENYDSLIKLKRYEFVPKKKQKRKKRRTDRMT